MYKKMKRVRRPRFYRKSKILKKNKTIRRIVKKELHSQVENKYNITQVTGSVIIATTTSDPLLLDCIPFLSYGNTTSTRIGSKVKVVSAKLTMMITPNIYDATTNPQSGIVGIRCVLFKNKLANDTALAAMATYFRQNAFAGNSTSQGLQGYKSDLIMPINRDAFTVFHDRVYYLGSEPSAGTNLWYATNGIDSNQGRPALKIVLPLTKHLGLLHYNDSASTYVVNKNLWCVLIPMYPNSIVGGVQNTAITATNIVPANLYSTLEVFYEDC